VWAWPSSYMSIQRRTCPTVSTFFSALSVILIPLRRYGGTEVQDASDCQKLPGLSKLPAVGRIHFTVACTTSQVYISYTLNGSVRLLVRNSVIQEREAPPDQGNWGKWPDCRFGKNQALNVICAETHLIYHQKSWLCSLFVHQSRTIHLESGRSSFRCTAASTCHAVLPNEPKKVA
jgi:hypothetical protein